MKRITVISGVLALILLGLVAANLPNEKYADVIKDNPEVGLYLKALLSAKSKLSFEELEQVEDNRQKKREWMSGDKAFLQTRIPGEVVTMFDSTYLVVFDNALVTCGKLRFGIGEEPLLDFIAARRSSVGLVYGDANLKDSEFALLHDVVCMNKPYLQ